MLIFNNEKIDIIWKTETEYLSFWVSTPLLLTMNSIYLVSFHPNIYFYVFTFNLISVSL